MSKSNGLGKFVVFCAAVGAAAAGVYFYLTKRDEALADELDDDFYEDFDDFEDDDDDTSDSRFGNRKYVDIKSSEDGAADKEPAKEGAASESAPEPAPAPQEAAPDSSEEFFDDDDED